MEVPLDLYFLLLVDWSHVRFNGSRSVDDNEVGQLNANGLKKIVPHSVEFLISFFRNFSKLGVIQHVKAALQPCRGK